MIHEYKCRECGHTFIGEGADTEEHYSDPTGGLAPCGGVGDLVGTWSPPTLEPEEES